MSNPAVKLIGPMHRLDRMSREDFKKYYVEQHTQAASGLPGMIKYTASPALRSANGDNPPFDAVAEMWWANLDEMVAAYTDEAWEKARRDHPSVVSGRMMFMAEEHVILPPPPVGQGVKYLALLSRADTISKEDFRSYWFDKHLPLALKTPGLLGYKASVGIASANGDSVLINPMDAPQFDGAVEMWFESEEAFDESFADPFWDLLRVDYYQNFAMGRIQFLLEEHLVFDNMTAAK